MRKIWRAIAVALVLAACQQPAPEDPLAQARQTCADAEAASAARIEACSAVVEAGGEAAAQAEALAHRGDAKRSLNDVTGALRDYEAALAANAENVPALTGRGAILLASGQLDAATPLLERAVAGDQSGRADMLLGRIALQRGDYATAVTHLDAAIAKSPNMAEALAARARAKQRLDDNAGARADYNAAIRADGTLAEARAGRCWLNLIEDVELPQARNDAEAAAAADPQLVEGQICRGILQLRGEEWAHAQASFEAALQVEPGNPSALFGRGVARRRGGDNGGTRDMNQARNFDSRITDTFIDYGVNTY
jgi:tetratricopeptide (TPR) repeat protein